MNQRFSKEMATSNGDPVLHVHKLHVNRGECYQATGSNNFGLNSKDISKYLDPKRLFNQEKYLKYTNVKLDSSKPLDRLEVRNENYFFSQNHTVCARSAQTTNSAGNINNVRFNKKEYQTSGYGFQCSKVWEEISSRIEKLPYMQKHVPFITYADNALPISDVNRNTEVPFNKELLHHTSFAGRTVANIASRDINQKGPYRNETSLNELEVAFRRHVQSENLRKDSRVSTSGQRRICFENLCSSNKANEKKLVASEHSIIKNIEKISEELLAITHTNSLHEERSYLRCNPLPADIHGRYIRLYDENESKAYNYSMNLMAYIEFLEDNSWCATRSFLSDNVKMHVQYIWNKKIADRHNQAILQIADYDTFKRTIVDLLNLDVIDNFVDLFHNSIFVCGIGVKVRKQKIEAALFVINILEEKIEEFEHSKGISFQKYIEDYTKSKVNHLKSWCV